MEQKEPKPKEPEAPNTSLFIDSELISERIQEVLAPIATTEEGVRFGAKKSF